MPKAKLLKPDRLKRECFEFGYTPEGAKNLWIEVRRGHEGAKMRLNQIATQHPGSMFVWRHFLEESRIQRASKGKKNPSSFGYPVGEVKGGWSNIQAKGTKGVLSINSGGLPSLGKRN